MLADKPGLRRPFLEQPKIVMQMAQMPCGSFQVWHLRPVGLACGCEGVGAMATLAVSLTSLKLSCSVCVCVYQSVCVGGLGCGICAASARGCKQSLAQALDIATEDLPLLVLQSLAQPAHNPPVTCMNKCALRILGLESNCSCRRPLLLKIVFASVL